MCPPSMVLLWMAIASRSDSSRVFFASAVNGIPPLRPPFPAGASAADHAPGPKTRSTVG